MNMNPDLRPALVTFYMHTLYNGGVERVFFNLAQQMLARGVHVHFVFDRLSYSPFAELVPKRAEVYDLSARMFLDRPFRLSVYLRRHRPHAVIAALHFSNEMAVMAKVLSGCETRLLLTEHTTLSVELGLLPWWNPRRIIIRKFSRWLYRYATARLAVSIQAARDTESVLGLPARSVRTIYNGVISDQLFQKSEEFCPHPWFRDDVPIVLGVGRLELQKDFPCLIRAIGIVRRSVPVRLLILGVGSQRTSLKSFIDEQGLSQDVSLGGFVENPYPYMARAQLFVLSSIYEGLPTVLIEALALGIPVVSTDCPSGPREILDQGRLGEIVPVRDPEALASAIKRSIERRTRIEPDRAWLEQFTATHACDEYLALAGVKP